MKHVEALVLKFIIVAVILELVLMSLTNLTFGRILFISLIVTVLAYLIGDMLILPHSNNTVATICDFILALFTVLIFNYVYYNARITFWAALFSAAIIGVGEWFFHKYLVKRTIKEEEHKMIP